MYMKDGRKLWEKFLIDMCVDQLTEEDYFFDLQGNKFNPGMGLCHLNVFAIYLMYF